MEPIDITVYVGALTDDRQKVGEVKFDGKRFDYTGLNSQAVDVEAIQRILEMPQTVPLSADKSYGEHTMVPVTLKPFTIPHLLWVTNRRFDNGYYLEANFVKMLAALKS